jgi:hypothetical protein
MNGMFSNSRGLGDMAKHLHITDCCRDHNLDFVAISEKRVDGITHQVFLTAFLAVLTLSGFLDHPVVVRVASLSAYELIPWIFWIVRMVSSISKFISIIRPMILHGVSLQFMVGDEFKAEFLRELVNLTKYNSYLILIGGNFNLLQFCHEKSKGRFGRHWPFLLTLLLTG